MATRINTKFVITLVSVLVLIVLGLIFASMFLRKTAADHVELAEAAMLRADAAIAQGDITLHNSECRRASKHFGSAQDKDPNNLKSLHGFLAANEALFCSTLTAAGNQLESILSGATSLHDTPSASDKDREVLYEMLHNNIRMSLAPNGQNPIGAILGYSTNRLDVAPEDPVATKYNAIAVGYLAGNRTKEEEVAEDIQKLNAAAKANPNDPLLLNALARYHQGNARRIRRTKGNTLTDAVNASFALSFENVNKAMQLAQDNPSAYLEAAIILADIRSGDDAMLAKITERQNQVVVTVSDMLADRTNRDALHIAELSNAIALIRRARPAPDADPPRTFDGPAKALELAELLPKDRPDQPGAYQVLANLQRETNRIEPAIATLKKGADANRPATAGQFIRDHQSRLTMKLLLADLETTMALRSGDPEQRDAALSKISDAIGELANADTLTPENRDARVAFLRGQIAFVQNKPQLAVTLLETANTAYKSKDIRTLRLLAQTHAKLRHDAQVTSYYETIVTTLRPEPQDLLNLINQYLNPGENQKLEKAEAILKSYQAQVPNDIRGIRLQARLLQAKGQTPKAIALLKEQDLAENPDLLRQIAQMQAAEGNADGVIDILREQLTNTPDGERMDTRLVSQLLNLLPEPEAKKAELQKLVGQGLDQKIANIFERVQTSGKHALEDELEMVELLHDDPADEALQKYLTYRRWNQADKGKPFLDQAIKLSPKNPSVLEWRYKSALGEKRWNDAQQAIKDMLVLSPNERPAIAIADGRFLRAHVLAAQAEVMDAGEARNKSVRNAIVAYDRALDQYSNYIEGWIQLSRLHLFQENYFAAEASLKEALNLQSQNVTAMELLAFSQARNGDRINALENYERVLDIQPGRASALNQFTALAQEMGLSVRAIQLREQIAERLPSNFNNRRTLALLYAQNNAFADAKKAIDAVIQEQGSTRQNITIKSLVLSNNKEYDQAIQVAKDYFASLDDEPTWQDHLLLAQVYEQAKQTDQADLAYSQAIKLEKADQTFASLAAFGQAKVLRGQLAEAAQMFEGLIEQYPDNDAIRQQTAELYLQLRDYDKVESIAKDLPDSADRHRLMIQSAANQNGKLGTALERATQAVESYPSNFNLRLSLVELLRAQEDIQTQEKRDYSNALTQAKALAKDNPRRVAARIALADVLTRMDRLSEAAAELDDVLSFAPRNDGANERLFRIRLAEANQQAASDPEASRKKAQEAFAIISALIERRPDATALLRSAGQAAELAGLPTQAIDYYRRAFEAGASAENLATYAISLLANNQGTNARAVLEDPANATLVSSSLSMRALRGRAIAAAGQKAKAATLFGNLLKGTKDPRERMVVAQQAAVAFANEPAQVIEILEGALGKELPVEIEELVADRLISRQQYELTAQRLIKYWDNPVADAKAQLTLLTQLALAQQESGKLVDAKATYERAYDMMTKSEGLADKRQRIQLLNNMAYLLSDRIQGYTDDAVQYAEQAVALMSDRDSAQQYALIEDTLGWAYHKAGRDKDAIRVLKQSVERSPIIANQLHLGQVYLATDDKVRALLVLEAALNQAKAAKDAKMIAEVQKWYRQAL